jgi:hypothetical protein
VSIVLWQIPSIINILEECDWSKTFAHALIDQFFYYGILKGLKWIEFGRGAFIEL